MINPPIESEENNAATALLSSSWKNPGYPRSPADIQHLFSGLSHSQVEKLFGVMRVLADKAETEISKLNGKEHPKLGRYPFGLWLTFPHHTFPSDIGVEDIKYTAGLLHDFFGVLKSYTPHGDYEFSIKFNSEAADFLFLKKLVDKAHNHLNKISEESEGKQKETRFDDKKSTLFIAGKEIIISKSKRLGQHLVLKTIFSEVRKEWTYDEIFSDLNEGIDYDKRFGKSIRNRCYQINLKIAAKTTIADFLINTNRTVQINEKYLP